MTQPIDYGVQGRDGMSSWLGYSAKSPTGSASTNVIGDLPRRVRWQMLLHELNRSRSSMSGCHSTPAHLGSSSYFVHRGGRWIDPSNGYVRRLEHREQTGYSLLHHVWRLGVGCVHSATSATRHNVCEPTDDDFCRTQSACINPKEKKLRSMAGP
ncbi:hypothetical protein BP00DRAFT_23600 [Aspergillus indologenus CBS 114.80]|uniref:Uncharacterized protein n=1 Tax=Aspergillus indologenus CBS 114.80 TaxID=1450541 RepID=A0A2V5JF73_9EURO|nr:hypothetical protein BP00DRAFT_23600 [Aspergillus indologenus CBS 114.80]